MNACWKKLFLQSTIWLLTEITFSQVGLDTLADYSEYIFDKNYLSINNISLSIKAIK